MELLIFVGALVVVCAVAFYLWPKISNKIDEFQEDMDEARAEVEEKFEEIADDIEEAVEKALDKIPSDDELKKLTKAKLDELAKNLGIKLDRRKSKDNMIVELKNKAGK
jgi:Tfp pilus assembly protein PilO